MPRSIRFKCLSAIALFVARVPSNVPAYATDAIDIFPAIAAAAGLKAPENLQGIDLLDAEARR